MAGLAAAGQVAAGLGAGGRARRGPDRSIPEARRGLPAFLTSALLLAAVGLLQLLPGRQAAVNPPGTHLPWWALATAFAAAEMSVFHIEVGREAHTFTLSEIPFVLALFFASPAELIVGRMIGEAIVLIVRDRQELTKLVFNLSMFLTECAVAEVVVHGLGAGHRVTSWPAWPVAFAAVGAADLVSVAAVSAVIRLHGGHVRPARLAAAAGITAGCNTALALVTAILVTIDPAATVLLVIIALALVAAYRAYNALSQRYEGLEELYQFTKITSGARRAEAALEQILVECRRLLRADSAVIVLRHGDERTHGLQFCSSITARFTERERRTATCQPPSGRDRQPPNDRDIQDDQTRRPSFDTRGSRCVGPPRRAAPRWR